ncbi:MAG: hypothetical protein IPL49_22075 [Saprospirales bacterium]|nr:hypothetical protein [Saprospirales bacterium]
MAEQLNNHIELFSQTNIEFIRQQNTVTTIQRELTFRERQRTGDANPVAAIPKT